MLPPTASQFCISQARVAELVDARDLKSLDLLGRASSILAASILSSHCGVLLQTHSNTKPA